MKYYNPINGFTKGTYQGLTVCGILLTVLILFAVFVRVVPGSVLSRVLDLVFGLCAAVAVVWVIGGTFEIEGKYLDFGIKATGGAGVLIAIIFLFQPISKTVNIPEWPVSYELLENEPLNEVITLVDNLRREGKTNYTFDFNGNEKEIRQFRPIDPTLSTSYNAKDWPSIFARFDEDSPCLSVTEQNNNVISLKLDVSRTETKEVEVGDDKLITIRICQ